MAVGSVYIGNQLSKSGPLCVVSVQWCGLYKPLDDQALGFIPGRGKEFLCSLKCQDLLWSPLGTGDYFP
jgi:hypothetical protein